MLIRRFTITLSALAALACVPCLTAKAQPREVQAVRDNIVRLDTIVIPGRRQLPGATYILSRSRVEYATPEAQAGFVRRVRRTVRRSPF